MNETIEFLRMCQRDVHRMNEEQRHIGVAINAIEARDRLREELMGVRRALYEINEQSENRIWELMQERDSLRQRAVDLERERDEARDLLRQAVDALREADLTSCDHGAGICNCGNAELLEQYNRMTSQRDEKIREL